MYLRSPSSVQSRNDSGAAQHYPRAPFCCCLLLLPCLLIATLPAQAQTDATATKPYATLERQSVTYRGPVRSTDAALTDDAVIGMVLPLSGARLAQGKALLAAAQIALEEENALGGLAGGQRLQLAVRDESGPWGQASMEILKLYDQDHALAILTSANGASAHLAEQIANKISIPILTLSSDSSTTQANVPWLFRLGPSDTDQARAFCQRIYRDLSLKNVLLVAQTDHDGRVGAAEFVKVAETFSAAAPLRVAWSDSVQSPKLLQQTLRANPPEAMVIWSDDVVAGAVVSLLRAEQPATPVFLCRKAAELPTAATGQGEQYAIDSITNQDTPPSQFERAYIARTGANPGLAAYEIYRGVHTIALGLRANGSNRVLLRDYLASESTARFDAAGNDLQPFAVVKLQAPRP